MAVHGSEPTIPCRTMIWNVCTLTTDFMAVQDSSQTDAALEVLMPLIMKSSLQYKAPKSQKQNQEFVQEFEI